MNSTIYTKNKHGQNLSAFETKENKNIILHEKNGTKQWDTSLAEQRGGGEGDEQHYFNPVDPIYVIKEQFLIWYGQSSQ